jgi:hypothetical protein
MKKAAGECEAKNVSAVVEKVGDDKAGEDFEKVGMEMLIPLTQSLYIPARSKKDNKVRWRIY